MFRSFLRFLYYVVMYIKKTYEVLLLRMSVNRLQDDKFLDWSKSKAFADDKINVTT